MNINSIDKKTLAEAIKVLDKIQGIGVVELKAPKLSKAKRDYNKYKNYLSNN